MNTQATFVQIAGYAGLLLAASSTVWGLLFELTVKDDLGAKHLTRAGWAAIALIIAGLTINLSAKWFGAKLDARAAEARKVAEKRAVLVQATATQPLMTLKALWRFNGISASAQQGMESLEGALQETFELDDEHGIDNRNPKTFLREERQTDEP